MGEVYANGREILSKGDHGKVTGVFPDVCHSPPSPPAGPVPAPYANSSRAGDLERGSKRVEIERQPIGLRDESYLKTSPLGNEAATRSFGANLVTHQTTGKTYFNSWSLDVKVEGEGVIRHLDLATSNHGSYPGGTPPFPNLSSVHALALSRVEAGECPCCGSNSCAAAFKPGEEPLSMREALGLDPNRPGFNAKRAEEFRLLRTVKKQDCTCGGKVSPSPPCDVFRKPDSARHKKIEAAWAEERDNYKMWYHKTHGAKLHDWRHFSALMKALLPEATQAKMSKAAKLSRKDRRVDHYGKLLDDIIVQAKKTERINHLTPKESGGCPTNPDNLQPQQTLCSTCQTIDQFLTDCWQGKQ